MVFKSRTLDIVFWSCSKFAVSCNPLQVPAPLRQSMMFKSYDLTQLTERDIDNMFRGLYIGKEAFYALTSVFGTLSLERVSLEVSNILVKKLFEPNFSPRILALSGGMKQNKPLKMGEKVSLGGTAHLTGVFWQIC